VKATRIATDIFSLAEEAVRVRDQERHAIDGLKKLLVAVTADRDDARADYQALALKTRDVVDAHGRAQQINYLRRIVERVESALAAGMRVDLPADWVVTLTALGETEPPSSPSSPGGSFGR